ncbi:MAG: hypothetical protein IJO57_02005 [Bacilli bacterium]|nr:hypothetical protein [Bacilli bacterium]
MNSEVYKYLLEYGFNDEEINYIDENNDMIWKTNLLNCISVFELLKEKEFNFDFIHNLILDNPLIISLSVEELEKTLLNK